MNQFWYNYRVYESGMGEYVHFQNWVNREVKQVLKFPQETILDFMSSIFKGTWLVLAWRRDFIAFCIWLFVGFFYFNETWKVINSFYSKQTFEPLLNHLSIVHILVTMGYHRDNPALIGSQQPNSDYYIPTF